MTVSQKVLRTSSLLFKGIDLFKNLLKHVQIDLLFCKMQDKLRFKYFQNLLKT